VQLIYFDDFLQQHNCTHFLLCRLEIVLCSSSQGASTQLYGQFFQALFYLVCEKLGGLIVSIFSS
jgi:hypothetical protein